MTNWILKLKFYLYHIFFIFFSSGVFIPPAHSQEPNLLSEVSSYYWDGIRKEAPVYMLDKWHNQSESDEDTRLIINYLKTPEGLRKNLMVHKWKKVSRSFRSSSLKTSKPQIKHFIQLLKKGSYGKIKNFIKRHELTETDKIISALYLIQRKDVGPNILGWMNDVGLSVNHSLKFKNINLSSLSGKLKTKDLMKDHLNLAVLGHYLAGTGQPKIIQTMVNSNYNPGLKNYLDENILHSFIRLTKQNPPSEKNRFESLQLILMDFRDQLFQRDIMAATPLDIAEHLEDELAIKLINEKLKGDGVVKVDYRANILKFLDSSHKPQPSTADKNSSAVYLDWSLFLQKIALTMGQINNENPVLSDSQRDKNRQSIANLHKTLHAHLLLYEMTRVQETSVLLSKNIMNSHILKAIFRKDKEFFEKLSLEQKSKMRIAELLTQNTHDNSLVFVSDPLLESIRGSWLYGVNEILSKDYLKNSLPRKTEIPSLSPDPLSLAIMTYAFLPTNHPLKKDAKTIIQILAKRGNIAIEPYNYVFNFNPMEWAVLLGLNDIVKLLHETYHIEVPKDFTLNIVDGEGKATGEDYVVNVFDLVTYQDWEKLKAYLSEKVEYISETANAQLEHRGCQKVFLH